MTVIITDGTLNVNSSCITICKTRAVAESMIHRAVMIGFNPTQLSMAGPESIAHLKGPQSIQIDEKDWFTFEIRELGLLAVSGPLALTMTMECRNNMETDIMNCFAMALYKSGVPQSGIEKYESALQSGKFVLVAHGSQKTVECICDLFGEGKSEDVIVHVSP